MGYGLTYKNILDSIADSKKNQYYLDIAYQLGNLLYKIFDFEPLEADSLQ